MTGSILPKYEKYWGKDVGLSLYNITKLVYYYYVPSILFIKCNKEFMQYASSHLDSFSFILCKKLDNFFSAIRFGYSKYFRFY